MPSAIQIISKLRLMKLHIPPTGLNANNYYVISGKNPKKPKSWAGNFAVVTPADRNGRMDGEPVAKKVALRFFLAKTPSHITQITSFINNNPHFSLVGCKMYRDMLSLKDGENVDMMEMDFVEGPTLDDWIEQTLLSGSKDKLVEMAEGIRTVTNQLVSMGFYHGDLSHSNIMVDQSNPSESLANKIRLIDYDSVLVKEIKNPPDTKEAGHPNFQHPSRKASRFTMLEDVYFTTLGIYVSLIAISENPKLWQAGLEKRDFHSKGDNLIFQSQRGDLENTNTELWNELGKINYPGETKKAFDCLKNAVNTETLVGSDFLSRIEEWFSTGTMPPPVPTPTPGPKPVPPSPNPPPGPKPSPSPKPSKKKPRPPPSPKPKPRTKASKSPSPRKRVKSIKEEIHNIKPSNNLQESASGSPSTPPSPPPPPPLSPPDGDDPFSGYKWKEEVLEAVMENYGIEKSARDKFLTEVIKSLEAGRTYIKKSIFEETAKKWPNAILNKTVESTIVRPKVRPELMVQKKTTRKSRKKKQSRTIPVPFEKLSGKKIVIDGANALHESSSDVKSLELSPFQNLISLFEDAGAESVSIVFDASTQHKFSEADLLKFQEMIAANKGNFTLAPKATEADSIILNIAQRTQSIVITNDFYGDYKKLIPDAYDWFKNHHITISYVMGIWTMNTTIDNQFME